MQPAWWYQGKDAGIILTKLFSLFWPYHLYSGHTNEVGVLSWQDVFCRIVDRLDYLVTHSIVDFLVEDCPLHPHFLKYQTHRLFLRYVVYSQ